MHRLTILNPQGQSDTYIPLSRFKFKIYLIYIGYYLIGLDLSLYRGDNLLEAEKD